MATMQVKKNTIKCGLNYGKLVSEKLQELMTVRKQSATPDVYLYVVRLLLLKDLYGLQESWDGLTRCFDGCARIVNARDAYQHVYVKVFMAAQAKFMLEKGRFEALMKEEPTIGSVAFSRLRELADMGSSGDNHAVEELEYCFVARSTVVALALWWAALGVSGVSKQVAFSNLVEYMPCDEDGVFRFSWLDSFSGFFECAEKAVNPVVGGVEGQVGLYKCLPPLW